MDFEISTFALEIINFIVLTMLMLRFVYRPIAAAIDARRQTLRESLAEARQLQEAAQRRGEELDARSRELDVLRERIFGEATAQAAQERARLIGEARQDATAERARVHALLEGERVALESWVAEAAIDQGADLAGELLLKLAPGCAHDALLKRLLVELAAFGPAAGAAAPPDEAAELTLAEAPSDAALAALKEALQAHLGPHRALTLKLNPALGAGAILRLGHQVFDASVAAQIAAIRAEAHRARVQA